MRVAVFVKSNFLPEIEDDINEWLEKEGLCDEDIMRVTQSQSSNDDTDILIISVWYIPHRSENLHTCTCGAGTETPPTDHNEQCLFYCPF